MDSPNAETPCRGCGIPQPDSQFQDLENFKFPGAGAVPLNRRCVSCQAADPRSQTDEMRKRACTVANELPLAHEEEGAVRTCTKCGHSKAIAHFASYRRPELSTKQCSECRDTSLRAKHRAPPNPPPAAAGRPPLAWIFIRSPRGMYLPQAPLVGFQACTGQESAGEESSGE